MTHVLVIEDEKTIRNNIIETLEIEQYRVSAAANGLEGVEAALNELPDLILCDIAMPGLDGYGVLLEMQSHPTTVNVPLIFLTAHADRASMRQGMEMGAADYVTKPFSSAELLRAVRTQLDKREAQLREAELKAESELESLRTHIIHALPHELRTPLSGIIGCADFLLLDWEQIDRDQMKNIAEIIMRSGSRLQRVLENYIVYAQLEVIASDPRRLNGLREECCDYLTAIVADTAQVRTQPTDMQQKPRDADLHLNVEGHDAVVAMSPDNVARIVTELVDNAFKFSKPGDPVTVTGCVEGQAYSLTIADQGRGMSAEQIGRIGAYTQFEREFYEQQGLGLGLIISKRLVELHGGAFTIESEKGVGTTVHLSIPLAADTATGPAAEASQVKERA